MDKQQIILGTLLGDATIPKQSNRSKTSRISWEHSLNQEEYALWKANSLDNFSIYRRSRLDSRTNNTYHSIIICSTVDNYLHYRNLFYNEEGKKVVSQEVLNLLSPEAIAVWFMDDGNLYYNGNSCHLTLSVNGFTSECRQRIIEYFKEKFDINFKVAGKAIRLTSVREVTKFESYFSEYYHETMKYKTLDNARERHKNK